jgi:hypothetical protein
MSEYWFTNEEREQLCVNPECEEHGDGVENCDIPSQQPDKEEFDSGIPIGLSSAEPLTPEVSVVKSESE